MTEIPSSTSSSGQGAPTLPLSCPRCEIRAAGDWCCWELADLKLRIARNETIRQLRGAFVGKSAAAIRGAAWRYKLGVIAAGERTRRKKCAAGCGAYVGADAEACDACNRPSAQARAA